MRLVTEAPVEPLHRIDDHLVSLLTPASFAAEQYRALRLVEADQEIDLFEYALQKMARRCLESQFRPAQKAIVQYYVLKPLIEDSAVLLSALAHVGQENDEQARTAFRAGLERLGLDPNQPGLVDAIVDPRLDLVDIARTVHPFNFAVVLGGQSAKSTYELFKAARLRTLLEEARESYAYVVIDAPPLLPMPDCQLIGGFVDKFIVVLACDKTPRRALAEALNVLAPDKVLGLVFNRNDQLLSDYRQEDYGEKVRGARWRWAAKRIQPFNGAKTRSSHSR